MSNLKHQHPNCLNCHYPLAEFDKFCPHCGQKPISPKSSMHDLLHEFFHTFWHLDGKFFMTLYHLLIPGKLTTEFFKGHLKRYAHPIQLFLVLGAFAFGLLASAAKSAEEQAQASMDKKRDEYKRKSFLKELDSVRHTLVPPQYSYTEKSLLSDSLMFKMMHPNRGKTTKEQIENEVKETLDKEFNKLYNVSSGEKISVNVGTKESKVNSKILYEDDEIHDKREAFKDSMVDVLVKISNKSLPKGALEGADSLEIDGALKGDAFARGAKGFRDAMKEDKEGQKLLSKLLPKIENINKKQPLKEAIIMYEDTNNISVLGEGLRIPSREVYELSPDEIIEKYKVKGFWQKIATKQGLKATQDAGNLIHFYMSKLFWATVIVIPVLSLFLSLIYRRRKRYYVEHIVFLLHLNTAAFLVLIPVMWLSKYVEGIIPFYFPWLALHFVLSLKVYYQQSWVKTLIKAAIVALVYFIIAVVFVTFGAIIGFIFF
jgi:ribosomal protein S24E